MIRRMNVLIVPDEGGPARRLNVPTFLIRIAAWLILLVVIGLVAAFFSYARFIQKAFDWDRLATDNQKLRDENHRILRVVREVQDSRQVLINIVRSLQEERPTLPDSLRNSMLARSAGGLSDEALAVLKGRTHTPEQFLAYGLPTLTPLKGFLSQRYFEDLLFPDRSHRGVDIAGKLGAPIVAAATGRVVFEGWTPYYGNCLMLVHSNGYTTFYGHNRVNLKKVGNEAKRGEPIALLGNSGRSSAPHLHFEVWKDGASMDPLKLIQLK